ncbi:MAG: CBS domain-containing protein [bacterium]|nr:CBS domain-containing protein [bacterium]
MSTVAQILKEKGNEVITTSPFTSLINAVRLMIERKVGALLVTQNDQILGIFTERDFLRSALRTDKTLAEITVSEVMTKDLIVVTPEWELEKCLSVMTLKRCRHLPVMQNGKLVGMISIGDIGKFLSAEKEAEIQFLKEYIQGKW